MKRAKLLVLAAVIGSVFQSGCINSFTRTFWQGLFARDSIQIKAWDVFTDWLNEDLGG